MHKLTVDPSTKAGFCLLLDDSEKPKELQRSVGERLSYGTWDLTRDMEGNKCARRGQYYLNLWDNISQLRRHHGIEDEDLEIVIEAEAYSAARTEASAQLAGGCVARQFRWGSATMKMTESGVRDEGKMAEVGAICKGSI